MSRRIGSNEQPRNITSGLSLPPILSRAGIFAFHGLRAAGTLRLKMARTVLVVDDDALMRLTLERTLKQAGYEAISAADGNECLMVCRSRAVELVIIDLFMPNKEGMETIVELGRNFPQTAIIAMSGASDVAPLLSTARLLGAARTLMKPFEPEELLTAVEEALQG